MYNLLYSLKYDGEDYYFVHTSNENGTSLLSILKKEDYARYLVFERFKNSIDDFDYEYYTSLISELRLFTKLSADDVTDYFGKERFFKVLFNYYKVGNFVNIDRCISIAFQTMFLRYLVESSRLLDCRHYYLISISLKYNCGLPVSFIGDKSCKGMVNWLAGNCNLTANQVSTLVNIDLDNIETAELLFKLRYKVFNNYEIWDVLPLFADLLLYDVKVLNDNSLKLIWVLRLNTKILWSNVYRFRKKLLKYAEHRVKTEKPHISDELREKVGNINMFKVISSAYDTELHGISVVTRSC